MRQYCILFHNSLPYIFHFRSHIPVLGHTLPCNSSHKSWVRNIIFQLIIGGGDIHYEKFLKNEVKRLGLNNVKFLGFLSGDKKDEAISSLSVLAMPSEFENLGNVILEGLIRKIPCIATKGSPWEELITHKCGWWVDYNQEAITKAVKEAIETPNEELIEMGNRGRKLIEENYSIEKVAQKFKSLYEWIYEKKSKPSFIYIK